jgi:hypothetical protein
VSIRVGAGFRIGPHIWIGASVPLGHGRRLAAHRGHGERADPIQMMVGVVLLCAGRWRGDKGGRRTVGR